MEITKPNDTYLLQLLVIQPQQQLMTMTLNVTPENSSFFTKKEQYKRK